MIHYIIVIAVSLVRLIFTLCKYIIKEENEIINRGTNNRLIAALCGRDNLHYRFPELMVAFKSCSALLFHTHLSLWVHIFQVNFLRVLTKPFN